MFVQTLILAASLLGNAAPFASSDRSSLAETEQRSAAQQPTDDTAELQLHASPHAYLMVESLRRGGLILFVRHGMTSLDNRDQDDVRLADCRTQQSLSQAGRTLAAEVGVAVRELRLPVGPVFTSAYCRCRETADLMFGSGLRVADLAVDEHNDGDAGVRLLSVIARMPPPVGDTVIVGHLQSAEQAYGVVPDEGEMLVIAPAHDGQGPELIGHITATQWNDVVRDYRKYGDRITRMVNAALVSGAAAVVAPAEKPAQEK